MVAIVVLVDALLYAVQASAHHPTTAMHVAVGLTCAAGFAVAAGRFRLLATLALLVAVQLGLLGNYPAHLTLPTLLFGALGLVVALEFTPPAAGALAAVSGIAFVTIGGWFGDASARVVRLDDAVFQVTFPVGLALMASAARRGVIALDRLEQASAPQQVVTAIQAAEERLHEQARRVLHDDVIALLNSISDGTAVDARDVERVEQTLQTPLPRGAQVNDSQTIQEVIEDAVVRSGAAVVVAPFPEDVPSLAPDVGEVVARATAEALRNAERHGLPGSTSVSGLATGPIVQVEVRNVTGNTSPERRSDGQGGWGWDNSILAPLRAIGGDATLEQSGPHTVARLNFPAVAHLPARSSSERIYYETLAALGESGSAVSSVLLLYLAAHAFIAIRQIPHQPGPWAQSMVVLGICGVTGWAWKRYLFHGTMSTVEVAFIALASTTCTSVSLAIATSASLSSYASWVIGMVSVPNNLVALFSPLRRVLLTAGPVIAVVAYHALTGPLAVQDTAGAFVAAFLPLVTWAVAQGLRWTQRATRRAADAVLSVSTDAHAIRAAHDLDGLFAGTRRRVLPFLHSLPSQGVLDPPTRAMANLLAREVRDDLYLPGLLDDALKARLRAARRIGAQVTIPPPSGTVLPSLAVGLRVLDRALDLADARTRLIVDVPTVESPTMVITVMPKLARSSAGSAGGATGLLAPLTGIPHSVHDDDFATVISIPEAGETPRLEEIPRSGDASEVPARV